MELNRKPLSHSVFFYDPCGTTFLDGTLGETKHAFSLENLICPMWDRTGTKVHLSQVPHTFRCGTWDNLRVWAGEAC